MNNIMSFNKKHEYYNSIYYETHPYADKENRIYKKPRDDFSFKFVNNSLEFNKLKEVDITKNSIDKFKTFTEKDKDPMKNSIHEKISFYLSNKLIPVNFIN